LLETANYTRRARVTSSPIVSSCCDQVAKAGAAASADVGDANPHFCVDLQKMLHAQYEEDAWRPNRHRNFVGGAGFLAARDPTERPRLGWVNALLSLN